MVKQLGEADRRDDLVNPLTPWRSMTFLFLAAWGAILLDALDVPGRLGGRPGLRPVAFLTPFLTVGGYAVAWIGWKVAERRRRKESRAFRQRLAQDKGADTCRH